MIDSNFEYFAKMSHSAGASGESVANFIKRIEREWFDLKRKGLLAGKLFFDKYCNNKKTDVHHLSIFLDMGKERAILSLNYLDTPRLQHLIPFEAKGIGAIGEISIPFKNLDDSSPFSDVFYADRYCGRVLYRVRAVDSAHESNQVVELVDYKSDLCPPIQDVITSTKGKNEI